MVVSLLAVQPHGNIVHVFVSLSGILTDTSLARRTPGEAQDQFKNNEDIRLSGDAIAKVRLEKIILLVAADSRLVVLLGLFVSDEPREVCLDLGA